jgi:hypothetical protein
MVYNGYFSATKRNSFSIGALANLYMESMLKTGVVGDNDSAFNMEQWHRDRAARILAKTGIDVRKEPSIARVIEASLWELQNVYGHVYAELLACTRASDVARLFCQKIEGAGAAGAADRRALAADHFALWVADNRDFIKDHPAT